MAWLNAKIPPMLLTGIFAGVMWLVSLALPGVDLRFFVRLSMLIVLVGIGVLIVVVAALQFRLAQTTVNPLAPDKTSSLVTSGIFGFSRNPMYVGFTLVLIGWGVMLSNLFALAMCAGFVLYLNRYQIRPEEKVLAEKFGDNFDTYVKRVRRWV